MRSSALTVLASASAVSAFGIYPRPSWSEHPHPTFSYPGGHHSSATSSASASATSTAAAVAPTGAAAWKESQFDSLVAFGDSYTDESRLGYFINHKGAAPPVGYLGPESLSASDGGRIWARYVVQYSDEKINLYNYAVSGAVCSNELTPRWFSAINADFPDLNGYEVPAFLADKAYDINSATNETLFSPALTADNTVYAIWDGTNDLGYYTFIDDEEAKGATINDYVSCIFNQVDSLYAAGGRYFVLMDLAPLYINGEYGNASFLGAGDNQYWPTKTEEIFGTNLTAISEKMRLEVTDANAIYQYRTPYEVLLANRYPGSNFALYNVGQVFLDIHSSPSLYLNGSTPLQVNGYHHHCSVTGGNCTSIGDPDSYLWYDELHPSEQTQRTVAKNFMDVINGNSSYATYYSS